MKVLILNRTTPNVSSFLTLTMENILQTLRTKTSVQELWFIYMPDKLNIKQEHDSKITILDIHNYKNAKDVLAKEKPDIIFVWPTQNFIDFAFSLAGKHMKIPVIGGFHQPTAEETLALKSYLNMFFEKSVPTGDMEQNQFMRRGRFFIFKYLFLLKTQFAIKMNTSKIVKDFFILAKTYISHPTLTMNPRFSSTIHWVSGEALVEPLIRAGFDRSTLVLTGNPMYDNILKKINEIKIDTKDKKIRVLFAPTPAYEHGFTTKIIQDRFFKEVVKTISHKNNEIMLTVKIHPSSVVLSRYENLIKQIDSSINIQQKGDILDYLRNSDVVITGPDTSVLIYALLLKIPIIIFNFYNAKVPTLLERGLSLECKKHSNLIPMIYDIISNNPADKQKIDEFIKDYLFKSDGLASERICQQIMKITNRSDSGE